MQESIWCIETVYKHLKSFFSDLDIVWTLFLNACLSIPVCFYVHLCWGFFLSNSLSVCLFVRSFVFISVSLIIYLFSVCLSISLNL